MIYIISLNKANLSPEISRWLKDYIDTNTVYMVRLERASGETRYSTAPMFKRRKKTLPVAKSKEETQIHPYTFISLLSINNPTNRQDKSKWGEDTNDDGCSNKAGKTIPLEELAKSWPGQAIYARSRSDGNF